MKVDFTLISEYHEFMSSKLQKGFIVAWLPILIILLIVGAGSFYFLKDSNVKIGKAPFTFTSSPTGAESKGGENQTPENWLVYQNETYSYQISYPPTFHAQGDNEPPYPPPPVSKAFTLRYDNGEWCDFTIFASTNIEGFKGEISSIREQGKDTESLVPVAGVNAIVFDAQGGDAIDRSYYIDQNNPHLRMGYNYRPAGKYSQECADTVSKMISSFKLLK